MATRGSKFVSGITGAALVFGALALPGVAWADENDQPQPTADYDMSHDGNSLLDKSGNDNHAILEGISDSSLIGVDGKNILNFQGDEFAQLPAGLITDDDNDFSVELTVASVSSQDQFAWVLGDGIGTWNTYELGNHVFLNPASSENGQVFGGIRVKTDGNNGEERIPWGGNIDNGTFSVVTLVSSDDQLALYVDGEERSNLTHGKSLKDIVPDGEVSGYLGKSLYAPDGLFQGKMASAVIWDDALSPEQVSDRIPSAEERHELFVAASYDDLLGRLLGENTSVDAITRDLTPPTSLAGAALEWVSSDPDGTGEDGTIDRFIPEDQTVTLTATDERGGEYPFELPVRTLGEDGVQNLVEEDLAAVDLTEEVTENLPLIAEGEEGSDIVWSSSHPDVVSETTDVPEPDVGAADPFSGAGKVTRPAYGDGDVDVTLTADATLAEAEASREITVTVKELPRTAPDTGYVSAYFRSDSDERIYQAHTTENDFFTFVSSNDGEPTVVSTTGDKGLRDPFILRSVNGDKYYMVATDLCIGCGTGWGPAQQWGSLKIHVYESTDLVNWTPTSDEPGITVNQPLAGMTWAPEVYWDDDLEAYVVFFASRMYHDAEHTQTDGHAQMFYVITRDFKHFTYPPTQWQDTGHSRIDSTVMKIDDYYYRFTKNEANDPADGLERGKDIFLERSSVLTAPTYQSDPNANPDETWELMDTAMTTPLTGNHGEGPEIIKLNTDDPNNTPDDDGYVFLVDNYSAGGYVPFVTTGTQITESSWENRLSKQPTWQPGDKSGLPESPRHGAFVNVPQRVLDAVTGWTEMETIPSAVQTELSGRTATATVTAEDEGDVVGTVTFTSGDWEETVSLEDQVAKVSVPDSVSGTVVATYNGYDDEIVEPSSAEFEISAGDNGDDGNGDDGNGEPGDGDDGDTGGEDCGSGQSDDPGSEDSSDDDAAGQSETGTDESGNAAEDLPRTGSEVMATVVLALAILLTGLGVVLVRQRLDNK